MIICWDALKVAAEAHLYGMSFDEAWGIAQAYGRVTLIKKVRGNTGLGIREGKAVIDSWVVSVGDAR